MNALRIIYAIARADFLERVRRNSYLVTLLFTVYLGYAAGTGRISLRLGDYRGLYTSAWIGIMVSLVTTIFVSLVGFYIVRNAVDRDRQTGVGQILSATPLTKSSYFLGKFLSNLPCSALWSCCWLSAPWQCNFSPRKIARFIWERFSFPFSCSHCPPWQ